MPLVSNRQHLLRKSSFSSCLHSISTYENIQVVLKFIKTIEAQDVGVDGVVEILLSDLSEVNFCSYYEEKCALDNR